MPKTKEQPRPWHPAEYELADMKALQQLQHGEATEEQQKRALNYIIHTIAGTYDLPYYPDSARDSDFAQGKRFVGMQIVKLINLKLSTIKEIDNVRNTTSNASTAGDTKRKSTSTGQLKQRKSATKRTTDK